jgi:hypothetical protein
MSPKLIVPESQRNELVAAIVTLVTVILGIALTLTTQAITGAINPPPVLAPDAMQQLGPAAGVTNFSYLEALTLNVDTIEADAIDAAAIETDALSLEDVLFTGPVLAVSGTLSNTETLAHTAAITPTYAVCTAHGANQAIVTVTSKTDTTLTLSLITHAGAAANAIPVTCLVVP